MNRTHRIALLAGALSLAACQPRPATAPEGQAASDVAQAPAVAPTASGPLPAPSTPSPAPSPVATGANPSKADPYAGTNDGYPDLRPAIGPGDKAEKDARALLLSWARGIELREFDQAWSMMGDAAKSQVSKSAFNGMFAKLHDIAVAVPKGTIEGAAGSSYYTVPTTITGQTKDGSKRTLKGEVVLRRVNDVPGATAKQLTWHIEQINLKPG